MYIGEGGNYIFYFTNKCELNKTASQVALVVKNRPANAGDIRNSGLIPGLGRSPRGGHGNHSSILAWRIP